jgi:hypothetical protein
MAICRPSTETAEADEKGESLVNGDMCDLIEEINLVSVLYCNYLHQEHMEEMK